LDHEKEEPEDQYEQVQEKESTAYYPEEEHANTTSEEVKESSAGPAEAPALGSLMASIVRSSNKFSDMFAKDHTFLQIDDKLEMQEHLSQ
jgi:hypothetical protein